MAYNAGQKVTAAQLNDNIAVGITHVADGVQGGPQSFPSGSTTTVQWPVVQDPNSAIITVTGTNNTTFTVAKAGYFLIDAGLRLASGTTGLELSIKLNGNRVRAAQGSVLASCFRGKRLVIGDVITITAIHTSGVAKLVESAAEETSALSITRIGP